MVERKLYKTKLCMLYQRGRCTRQNCSFAHGNAELRRSFNGRQEYQEGRDLREKLGRIRSPLQNSPGWQEYQGDAKARHSSHGDDPRSPEKRVNHKKRKQWDGQSDYSSRKSDGTEDETKYRRQSSSDTKVRTDEQLRQMYSEIKLLESDKRQLEMYVEDKVKEADTLTSKTRALEMQLSKEKEESKRFTTRIKKFIKAHNRYFRLQEELKRSHAQIEKLGEQLDLDVAGLQDDSKTITISDDVPGDYATLLSGDQMISSPQKRRSRLLREDHDASNQVNPAGERTGTLKTRDEKLSRQSGNHDQWRNSKKREADCDVNDGYEHMGYEDMATRRINLPAADIASADKLKVSETGLILPSTGIAAHAKEEDVEVVEMDDKLQVVGDFINGTQLEPTLKKPPLPFLPPPPPSIPLNVYSQYKGDDESVDIDGIDEGTLEVDIV